MLNWVRLGSTMDLMITYSRKYALLSSLRYLIYWPIYSYKVYQYLPVFRQLLYWVSGSYEVGCIISIISTMLSIAWSLSNFIEIYPLQIHRFLLTNIKSTWKRRTSCSVYGGLKKKGPISKNFESELPFLSCWLLRNEF